MRTKILSLALLLVCSLSFGQTHLGTVYGVSSTNGDKKLTEVFSTAEAKAKFPLLFGWAAFKGWSDAEVMSMKYMEASWHDATWKGMNGQLTYATDPDHGGDITVPGGNFGVTYPLPIGQGEYKGAGAGWISGTFDWGTTQLYIDHTNWKTSRSADRFIMRSNNWGKDDGFSAWVHHTIIRGFTLNGKKRYPYEVKDSPESAGIALWDVGETSGIYNCYITDFEKDGILFVRGTPATAMNVSTFGCNRYGIAIIGGGNVTTVRLSGDECGRALVGGGPGYGRPGMTQLTMVGTKLETGTSAPFRPFKGTALIDFEGWVTITINGATFAAGFAHPWCLMRLKPNTNQSSVSVTGLQFFGPQPPVLLYDEQNDIVYNTHLDAWTTAVNCNWQWVQGMGVKSQFHTFTSAAKPVKGRIQHVGTDGATSWGTAGLFDPYGGVVAPPAPPPPPPPVVEPPPVVVDPPPPTSTRAIDFTQLTYSPDWRKFTTITASKVINSNNNARADVNWPKVTTLKFTLTVTQMSHLTLFHGPSCRIRIIPNTAGTEASLMDGNTTLFTGIKPNTPVSITLTLPSKDITGIGCFGNAGDCFRGTMENLSIAP